MTRLPAWRRIPIGWQSVQRLVAAWLMLGLIGLGIGWWVTAALPDGLAGIDRSVTVEAASMRTPGMNGLSSLLSSLGGTVTVTTIALVSGLLFLWRLRRWLEALVLWLGLAVEASLFLMISTVIGRARPPVEHLDSAPTASFPSGHVGAATTLYLTLAVVALWNARHRLVRAAAPIVASVPVLLVAAARVYRGMHYPTDVLAGFVLGAGTVYATVRVVERGRHEEVRA